MIHYFLFKLNSVVLFALHFIEILFFRNKHSIVNGNKLIAIRMRPRPLSLIYRKRDRDLG